MEIKYKPSGKVLRDFMRDDSFFRGVRGPVGSGKSVGCCIELFRRASQQAPGADGIRRSRAAVIRNTNPQLRTTTIKTWLDWFPEDKFGKFTWSPPYTHHIKHADIELEVIFLALDKPDDVKKLLSLELTFCWINEAREVPKPIVDACTMRVGRYPSMREGGPTWFGVIADTNSPEEDHWWPIMSGEAPLPDYIPPDQAMMLVKPESWTFFTQPAGMLEEKDDQGNTTGYIPNKKAENYKNLPDSYYPRIIEGKTRSWIDVYVMNRLGVLHEGKPVYPSFSSVHLGKEPLPTNRDLDILVGIDFGLTPAAVFAQRMPRGRWLILDELVCTDMGASRFAEALNYKLATEFPDHSLERIKLWGDPSGDFRAQTDERTPFMIMRAAGINVVPAPTNDPVVRIEAVATCLERMTDGYPSVMIDPKCRVLIAGFETGYHYKRLNVPGADRYDDRPDKNRFSHVHDACQYLFCGAGEAKKVLTGGREMHVIRPAREWDVFKRQKTRREPRLTRFQV